MSSTRNWLHRHFVSCFQLFECQMDWLHNFFKWRQSASFIWRNDQCSIVMFQSKLVALNWLLRRTMNHCRKTLVCATQRLCLLDRCMRLEHVLFWVVQHKLSLWNSHSQLNNKSAIGTLILHAEASFIPVERGLPRGILSQTFLKCHFCFGSFLSLPFLFTNNSKGV